MSDSAPPQLHRVLVSAFALAAAVLSGSCASAPATAPPPEREATQARPAPAPMEPEVATLLNRSIDRAVAGDADAAWEAARQAYRRAPHTLAVQVAWVEALLAKGERGEARTAALVAVDDHPDAVEAHYCLGRAYLALGRRWDALESFEAALALDPDDVPSLVGLLATHLHIEEHDDEVEELSDLLREKAPDDPYVLLNLAVAADGRGDTPSALALYRQAIDAAPALPIAHYNLARLLEREQGLEAARPEYEAFLREAEPGAARLVKAVRDKLEQKP